MKSVTEQLEIEFGIQYYNHDNCHYFQEKFIFEKSSFIQVSINFGPFVQFTSCYKIQNYILNIQVYNGEKLT